MWCDPSRAQSMEIFFQTHCRKGPRMRKWQAIDTAWRDSLCFACVDHPHLMFREPGSEKFCKFSKISEASNCNPSLVTVCWYGALAGGSGCSGCGFYQKERASRPLSSFGKLCCVACINRLLIIEPSYLAWIPTFTPCK